MKRHYSADDCERDEAKAQDALSEHHKKGLLNPTDAPPKKVKECPACRAAQKRKEEADRRYGKPRLEIGGVTQDWRWQLTLTDCTLVRLTDGVLGIVRKPNLANHYIRLSQSECDTLLAALLDDSRGAWLAHPQHVNPKPGCHLCQDKKSK